MRVLPTVVVVFLVTHICTPCHAYVHFDNWGQARFDYVRDEPTGVTERVFITTPAEFVSESSHFAPIGVAIFTEFAAGSRGQTGYLTLDIDLRLDTLTYRLPDGTVQWHYHETDATGDTIFYGNYVDGTITIVDSWFGVQQSTIYVAFDLTVWDLGPDREPATADDQVRVLGRGTLITRPSPAQLRQAETEPGGYTPGSGEPYHDHGYEDYWGPTVDVGVEGACSSSDVGDGESVDSGGGSCDGDSVGDGADAGGCSGDSVGDAGGGGCDGGGAGGGGCGGAGGSGGSCTTGQATDGWRFKSVSRQVRKMARRRAMLMPLCLLLLFVLELKRRTAANP